MAKERLFFWKLIKLPPQILYAIGLGPIYGRFVLLLTTIGRNTGKPRITPLQFEEIDGDFYIGSARGEKADWWKNIEKNPYVFIRVKSSEFMGEAELVTDHERIADFFEYKIQKRPIFIGAVMRKEGLPKNYTRKDMEDYAKRRAMVIIRPNR